MRSMKFWKVVPEPEARTARFMARRIQSFTTKGTKARRRSTGKADAAASLSVRRREWCLWIGRFELDFADVGEAFAGAVEGEVEVVDTGGGFDSGVLELEGFPVAGGINEQLADDWAIELVEVELDFDVFARAHGNLDGDRGDAL